MRLRFWRRRPTVPDPSQPPAPPLDRVADSLDVVALELARKLIEDRQWALMKRAAFGFVFVVGLGLWALLYGPLFGLVSDPTRKSVAVVTIDGPIGSSFVASAERLVPLIERACSRRAVVAVVLQISSPGGSPSAAERIAQAVARCREDKPVHAYIETAGASAAYRIAIEADTISANPYALVGSVGAIMRGLNYAEAAARLGIRETVFVSGEEKSLGSPLSEASPVQAAAQQALVDAVAARFIADVQARRPGITEPRAWEGAVWLADDALAMGLIDEVRVLEELLATEFADLRVHRYSPRRTLQDSLQLRSIIATMMELLSSERSW